MIGFAAALLVAGLTLAVAGGAWGKQPGDAVVLFGGEPFYVPADLRPHASLPVTDDDPLMLVFGGVKDDRVLGVDPKHLPAQLLISCLPKASALTVSEFKEGWSYKTKQRELSTMESRGLVQSANPFLSRNENNTGVDPASPIGDLLIFHCLGNSCMASLQYDGRIYLRYITQNGTKPEHLLDVHGAVIKLIQRLIESQK